MSRFWRRPSTAPERASDDALAFGSGSASRDTLLLQSQIRARAKSVSIDRNLHAPRPPSATLLILGARRLCLPS